MSTFETEALTPEERDRIIKTAVTPRPIAWISTVSADGVDNLAPFSSYNYVSSKRPLLLFNAAFNDDGSMKNTTKNVLETGEFAVNVVTTELAEAMDLSSAPLPADESEFDFAHVERAPCDRISPPRVADAAVTMECELHDSMEIYDKILVLGDVVQFHVSESVTADGKIDSTKLPTVGRLGGPYYTASEPMEMTRRY